MFQGLHRGYHLLNHIVFWVKIENYTKMLTYLKQFMHLYFIYACIWLFIMHEITNSILVDNNNNNNNNNNQMNTIACTYIQYL